MDVNGRGAFGPPWNQEQMFGRWLVAGFAHQTLPESQKQFPLPANSWWKLGIYLKTGEAIRHTEGSTFTSLFFCFIVVSLMAIKCLKDPLEMEHFSKTWRRGSHNVRLDVTHETCVLVTDFSPSVCVCRHQDDFRYGGIVTVWQNMFSHTRTHVTANLKQEINFHSCVSPAVVQGRAPAPGSCTTLGGSPSRSAHSFS